MLRSLLIALSVIIVSVSWAQAPDVRTTKILRSIGEIEIILDAKATPDGGFIVAGTDGSSTLHADGMVQTGSYGRPWLVKLDSLGNKAWEYNGSDLGVPAKFISSFSSVLLTDDGGYMAAGTGTLTGGFDQDFYLVKFNSNGTVAWRKAYGGSKPDFLYSMTRTYDGKYILVGSTMSVDGNVSGNHGAAGTEDVWMVCVDGTGNFLWQKCFGGSGQDVSYAVAETPDQGFLISGYSKSVDGDLQSNKGAADAWLIRTNANGQLLWQKNYGGAGNESFRDIVLNSDNTITVVGSTDSPVAEGYTNKGGRDAWLLKLSAAGNVIWSKGYGGTNHEEAASIQRIWGNEYLISGCTKSTNGNVSGVTGASDAWMFRVSADGNFIWGKTVGGGTGEDAASMAIAISETDYALFGYGRPAPVYTGDSGNGLFVRFGNRNTIKGTVYFDANSNGVKDPSEGFFSDGVVRMNPGNSALPRNGAFEFVTGLGNHVTTFSPDRSYFTVVPASANSNFSTYFNIDSFSFAVQPIANKKDLVINAFPLSVARPGFQVSYQVQYRNAGTESIPAGQILFKKDSRLTLVSANPANTSSSGDTLIWNYAGLNPGDSSSISLRFQIAAPPAVNLGDTLSSLAIITPVAGDETTNDNTVLLKQRVVGSYDPNDKTERNAGRVPSSFITKGEYLQYVIRFQNTGTDTAFSVVVRDTLDARLDWNTLQMIASSHSYRMSITESNKLAWTFSNINLPDSNVNEPASHGYIVYRIRPKSTVVVNDVIHNRASIYFDFNLPVLTNDASTEVRNDLTVLPIILVEFSGRMNGRKADLNWKTEDAESLDKFEVQRSLNGRDYATIGTLNSTGSSSSYNFNDDLSQLSAPVAYYRLKMVELDGKISFSQVLVFREQGVGSQLLVYPNPVKGRAFVSFMSPSKARIELQLIDATGRLVLRRGCDVEKGNNILSLSGLERFVPGAYTVTVINGAERLNSRIVIQ